MGSLNGRLRRLEEWHGRGDDAQERERRTEELRSELRARLQRIIDQEEEIEPWRLAALEVFRESIE